jgi:hypothetical protein
METADKAFKLNLDETAKTDVIEELKEDDGDQSSVKS